MESLWPSEFATPEGIPPVAILRQQAYFLGDSTKNIVEGMVVSEFQNLNLVHTLRFRVPALGINIGFLGINHRIIDPYPFKMSLVYTDGRIGNLYRRLRYAGFEIDAVPNEDHLINFHVDIRNEIEFVRVLEAIFTSDYTEVLIGALISQSIDT